MNDVLVAGHICLDIIPAFNGAVSFEPGRLIEVGAASISTGGVVSNTGLALYKLGLSTALTGKIGDDVFGRAVCEVIEKRGARLSGGMIVSPGEPTSYSIVISLTGEDRMFLHSPGCNDTFVAADVTDEAISNSKLLHFGYPTLMARFFEDDGRELAALLKRAKALGATTSFDVSLPDLAGPSGRADWRAILSRALPFTDLFLPSIEELMFMMDRDRFLAGPSVSPSADQIRTVAAEALSMGAKIVAVKAGDRGVYMRTANQLSDFGRAKPKDLAAWENKEQWAPVFIVNVIGTTGAGDAAIAGLLMGLLKDFSPEDALRAACAVGACSCEAADAVSGIQTWEATADRIAAGWPTKVVMRSIG